MSISRRGKRQNAISICNVWNRTMNNTYNTSVAINTFNVLTFSYRNKWLLRDVVLGVESLIWQETSPITAFMSFECRVFLSGNFHYCKM